MKIKSFVSAGEVYLHDDGKNFEIVPLQIFRNFSGGTCFRIGRNCYYFTKDGNYDGPECKAEKADPLALQTAFNWAANNRGRRPKTSYFSDGSSGYAAETKSWPEAGAEPPPEELFGYITAHNNDDNGN